MTVIGLLQALAAACATLGAALDQEQQQGRQRRGSKSQHSFSYLVRICHQCLQLWFDWPIPAGGAGPAAAAGSGPADAAQLQKLQFITWWQIDATSAAVLPAVARLTLALIRTPEAFSDGTSRASRVFVAGPEGQPRS
jgi:hypothetical protein